MKFDEFARMEQSEAPVAQINAPVVWSAASRSWHYCHPNGMLRPKHYDCTKNRAREEPYPVPMPK